MFNLLINIMTSALSGCLVAFLHIGYERATIKKVTNNQHLINPHYGSSEGFGVFRCSIYYVINYSIDKQGVQCILQYYNK